MHSESTASVLLEKVERSRLERRLTQLRLAEQFGITQPHYSKIVRGAVPLTKDMHEAMDLWLRQNPPTLKPRSDELGRLTRRIERDIAKLNRLLAAEGRVPSRRVLSRGRGAGGDG